MSTGEGNTLTLKLENKCDTEGCNCGYNRPSGIETSRKTDDPNAVGFVVYTHSLKSGTFTLKGHLQNSDKLGEDGEDIQGVASVSVYYWDGDTSHNKPLVIEVVKRDSPHEPEYFYKHGIDENEAQDDASIWRHHGHSGGTSLQDRLDDRNAAMNKVIPFNIGEPTKYNNFHSGASKDKTIKSDRGAVPLAGSDYLVTTYKLSDQTMKLSRIEYGKDKVRSIELPSNALDGIRLYSNASINGNLPIMVEFAGISGGRSDFHASNSSGSWQQVQGNIGNFYSGKDMHDQRPTEALTKKLDELVCSNYDGVTIDLTKSNSTTHTNNGEYCCDKHKGGKVSVKQGTVQVKDQSGLSVQYYKHSIKDPQQKIAGIKFYKDGNEDQRRRIKSSKFNFPMEGPVDIYTFYSGNNPALIYVNAEQSSPPVKGWFRRDSSGYDRRWKRTHKKLKGIRKDEIDQGTLECRKWNALVGELNKRGVSGLPNCQEPLRPPGPELRSGSESPGRLGPEEEDDDDEGIGSDEESEAEDSSTEQGAVGQQPPSAPPPLPGAGGSAPKPGPDNSEGTVDNGAEDEGAKDLAETARQEGDSTTDLSNQGKTANSSTPEPALSVPPIQESHTASEAAPGTPQKLVATFGLGSISGISSGTLTGTAATFFGGWKLYNRYKGDPWEKEDVGNSLKHGSNIISELRTSTLSPTHYYELYMKVFNELEYLADFIGEHVKRKNVISELYESVQQATYILPRLYLLVMIGAHYIKSKKVPAKDILTDITELCKGVQHPMRGLFLRYYLVQICKDKLPDSEPDNENGFLDSFDFLMNNFCQSIRLWVRLTAGGYEQKRLEKERIELGLLVGANLVRITQLDGVDINFYSKVALPRILEEIGLIKDSVAKKYLLDCLIQAFSDEFHIHTIDAILTACVASVQSDDGITILITMMNRLSDFIVANTEALPHGVDMFQTFYKHLSTIVIKGSPNDQSQDLPRVGIRGYLDLHAAFLDFTTKLYPGVIEHVEFIENNIMEVLSGILPPDTVIEGQAAHSILKLITIPLKTLSLKTLELEYNSKLIKLLDTPVKKKLAYTIIDELIEAKISMDNISSFDVFFDFIAPLFTPSEDEFSEVISEETSERIHLEQDQICKLIQTIKCSNIQDQFGIYKNLFEKIRESGSRRMKHSLPCLLSCSLKLLFPSHGNSSKGLDWPLNQIQFAFDIFNLAGLISDLIQPIIPEETIKLLVLCAITANEFGSMYCRTYGNESNFSADLKRLCGSFILKACTCYEDELSTGRDQLASLKYMTSAISSKIYIIEREDYYNIAMILARYGSNMVRLLHRCEALVAAAYLFQNAQYFNETRIIWCLEKCISIINTYDFVKPFTRVKAFLIPLEAAKFFKIGDVTNNIRVHIDKLLPGLSTDELEVYNKAIERIDRN